MVEDASRRDKTKDLEASQGPLAIRVNMEKRRAAGVEVGKITTGPWTDSTMLPAKLELDPDRHFAITAPVDVIVEDLLIPLGSSVEAGSPLLRLSAPEILSFADNSKPAKPN